LLHCYHPGDQNVASDSVKHWTECERKDVWWIIYDWFLPHPMKCGQ
jgi:hypothetical protein